SSSQNAFCNHYHSIAFFPVFSRYREIWSVGNPVDYWPRACVRAKSRFRLASRARDLPPGQPNVAFVCLTRRPRRFYGHAGPCRVVDVAVACGSVCAIATPAFAASPITRASTSTLLLQAHRETELTENHPECVGNRAHVALPAVYRIVQRDDSHLAQ